RHPFRPGLDAEVLEQRQRRALALQFGDLGAADAGAVTGEVDRRHAGTARLVAPLQPLPRGGVPCKGAAGEIRQLRLAAQPERGANRVADDAMLTARRIAPAKTTDLILAVDADRAHAGTDDNPRHQVAQ